MHYVCPAVRCWLEVQHERASDHRRYLLTRWGQVYTGTLNDFTEYKVECNSE